MRAHSFSKIGRVARRIGETNRRQFVGQGLIEARAPREAWSRDRLGLASLAVSFLALNLGFDVLAPVLAQIGLPRAMGLARRATLGAPGPGGPIENHDADVSALFRFEKPKDEPTSQRMTRTGRPARTSHSRSPTPRKPACHALQLPMSSPSYARS